MFQSVSDDRNTTAQVQESQPLLPTSAANQPPDMTGKCLRLSLCLLITVINLSIEPVSGLDVMTVQGNGKSQNVDEAYQQGEFVKKWLLTAK